MSDLKEMSRVLYDHQWERPDEWCRTLDKLADLSDDEIGSLIGLSRFARERAPG
jgi:hypothetical protein